MSVYSRSFGETLIETTMTTEKEGRRRKRAPFMLVARPDGSPAPPIHLASLSELRGFHGRRATDRQTDRPQSTSGVLAGCDDREK